jgi:hypothetical protein
MSTLLNCLNLDKKQSGDYYDHNVERENDDG